MFLIIVGENRSNFSIGFDCTHTNSLIHAVNNLSVRNTAIMSQSWDVFASPANIILCPREGEPGLTGIFSLVLLHMVRDIPDSHAVRISFSDFIFNTIPIH